MNSECAEQAQLLDSGDAGATGPATTNEVLAHQRLVGYPVCLPFASGVIRPQPFHRCTAPASRLGRTAVCCTQKTKARTASKVCAVLVVFGFLVAILDSRLHPGHRFYANAGHWLELVFACGAVVFSLFPIGPAAARPVLVAMGSRPVQDTGQDTESAPQWPKESEADAAERMKLTPKLADGRFSVAAPGGDVPLGSPLDLDLTFTSGDLVALSAYQHNQHGPLTEMPGFPKLVREEGETKTLEVIPLQLGPVDLEIGAVYSDNALARQTLHLNVVPSAKGLKKFGLNQGSHFETMVVGVEGHEQIWLYPQVTYADVPYPINLEDSTAVKLTVEQDDADPVIKVDPNGKVHALREGTAVIVADYAGVIDRDKVTVYSKDDAPGWMGSMQ